MNYLRFVNETGLALKDSKKLPAVGTLLGQFGRWVKYQRNNNVFQQRIPWLTFSAVDFLSNYIRPGMKVFEFGGGGSSLFFASRVAELVTVEHDREWFDALQKELKKEQNPAWSGNLIEPENSDTTALSISVPDHYFSDDANFSSKTFKQYASFIDRFPEEYFDIVLVDGRARPSCMKHSLSKVRVGGLLILDNADRSYYLENLKNEMTGYELVCDTFGPCPYMSPFTQTNIWVRKK